MSDVETQKYTITGLVDFSDEQGNITGQYPIGSVQELPVEFGDAAVEDGRAEAYEVSESEQMEQDEQDKTNDVLSASEEPELADMPGADDDLDLDLEGEDDEDNDDEVE